MLARLHRKLRLNEKGEMLVSVMIAAAVLAILSLATISMMNYMQQGQNNVKFRSEADTLHEEVRALLSSVLACENSFKGLDLQVTMNHNITAIKDASLAPGIAAYTVGGTYGDRAFILSSVKLDTYVEHTWPAGEMTLTITLDSAKSSLGAQSIYRKIQVSTQKDAANKLTTCISLAKMTDGIWRRNPLIDDIFFVGSLGGKVGIGTASPSTPLHVVGGTGILVQISNAVNVPVGAQAAGGSANIIKMENLDPTTGNTAGMKFMSGSTAVYSAIENIYASRATGVESGILTLTTRNAGVSAERMRIASNGNVGIGTTSPSEKLHVNDGGVLINSDTQSSYLNIKGNGGAGAFHSVVNLIGPAATDTWGMQYRRDTGNFTFGYFPSGFNTLEISKMGNVGVGTSVPSEKLHVVGNLRVQGSITDCTVGKTAGGVTCVSDIRLKNHVEMIDDALLKILSLRGVEFDWNEKSQKPGRHDIGVIAQDVEKVFPTAVVEDPATGLKMVDYAVLVAPIISAFKDVQKLLTELFSTSENHTREIAMLKATNVNLQRENTQIMQDAALKEKELTDLRVRLRRLEKAIDLN